MLGAALLVATLVLGGCGVGVQSDPEQVAPGPLASWVPGPATTAHAGRAAVFFVRGGHLVAAHRTLPPGDPLTQVVGQLVAGPVPGDGTGLTTALPTTTRNVGVRVAAGVATVDVPPSFARLGAHNQVLAVGQLVFTVMAQPGISGLQVAASGSVIEVPTDSGRLVSRPVTRADFASIAPLPN